jgi:CRP-like cAMP-binding protein
MREHAIAGEYRTWVVNALRQSPLFASLEPSLVEQVIGYGRLIELDANEFIVREGDPSDSFYLLLMGEAAVLQMHPVVGQMVESGRIRPVEAIGELGLLLRQPRSRSVVANRQTFCLRFGSKAFDDFTERLPGFARLLASTLASRAQQSQSRVLLPDATAEELVEPSPELTRLLTPQVTVQHRLVPLRRAEGGVVFGLASEPTAQTIAAIRRAIPQTPFRCVRVPLEYFERVARVSSFFGAAGERPPGGGGRLQAAEAPRRPTIERRQVSMVARLDQLGTLQPLLKRMVQNTASDLHLSARQRPWWRIDGDILEIDDAKVVAPSEVYDTLEPFLPDHGIREFEEHHDVDFSFAVEGLARFRVNMFREENGVSAAHDPERGADDGPARSAARTPEAVRAAVGAGAGDGPDRVRQVDDDRLDARPCEPVAASAHPDDRGPDRVPARVADGAREPARDRQELDLVLARAPGRPARGPGHRAGRRAS